MLAVCTPPLAQGPEVPGPLAPVLPPIPDDLIESSPQPTDQGVRAMPSAPVQAAIGGAATLTAPASVIPPAPAVAPPGPGFADLPSAMKRDQLPGGVFGDQVQVNRAAGEDTPQPSGATALGDVFTINAPADSVAAGTHDKPRSQLSGLFGGLSVQSASAGGDPRETEQAGLRRHRSISDAGLPDLFNDPQASAEPVQSAGVEADDSSRTLIPGSDPSESKPRRRAFALDQRLPGIFGGGGEKH